LPAAILDRGWRSDLFREVGFSAGNFADFPDNYLLQNEMVFLADWPRRATLTCKKAGKVSSGPYGLTIIKTAGFDLVVVGPIYAHYFLPKPKMGKIAFKG